MAEQPDGLMSIQDFVRWGASRFTAASLCFGHGTDNALDEAAHLVLSGLHLDPDLPASYRECRLTPAERVTVTELIDRRISERRPASYLTGRAWFAGLEMRVTDAVLVPRSPLAELIEAGFQPWVDPDQVRRVLDLCTGSGCIGIAAAAYLPEADVDVTDISTAALAVAEQNIARHGLSDRVHPIVSDLFAALSGQRYDLILSNPPYVARSELEHLPPEYRHEPELGFLGGEDGLDIVARILAEAAEHLTDDGLLILEVGAAAAALERRYPTLPLVWLELERGGEGVCLVQREQLIAWQALSAMT